MQLFIDSSDICKEFEDIADYKSQHSGDEKYASKRYTEAEELENKGEYEQALELHKEILAIRCQGNDMTTLADSLDSIGSVYMMKNDFSKANQYFSKALKYRSLDNDLIGFCTVHVNLSKMYFLRSLHTNEPRYLNNAVWALDIALAHISETRKPELYKSWKIKYTVLRAQMLRFSSEIVIENYRKVLSELTAFYDTVKESSRTEIQNQRMTAKNNIAVILAFMGEKEKAEKLMTDCLSEKEALYNIITNPKNTPCSITKNNLKAIKENRLQDLIFEY